MVNIVRLRKNENPPASARCVVITRDRSRQHAAEGRFVEHSNGATCYVPFHPDEGDLKEVMADALCWAEERGIGRIYIQE